MDVCKKVNIYPFCKLEIIYNNRSIWYSHLIRKVKRMRVTIASASEYAPPATSLVRGTIVTYWLAPWPRLTSLGAYLRNIQLVQS